MNIIVVEDDLEIQTLISYYFKKEGYNVDSTSDGLDALKKIKDKSYNLVILDLMLPGVDGKTIAKLIRDMPELYGNPKIIMVTAKTEIEDVLNGLELGADDYLKKPFDPRELLLRGKKLLESSAVSKNVQKNGSVHQFLNLTIDEDRFLVTIADREIPLSKKEFDLLLLLVINKGLVITREKILDKVWETSYSTGDRTVDVYIGKIREKLGDLGDHIKTIKGVGYKLEEKR